MKKKLLTILTCFVILSTFVTSVYALDSLSFNEVAEYELSVVCEVKGAPEESDEVFSVVVVPEEKSPNFEKNEIKVKANEKGCFGVITLNEPNVYTYTVHQKEGENKKMTYDKTEYEVVVNVITDETGLVNASQTITNLTTGEKVDSINFINTYETEGPKTGDNGTILLWVALLASLIICFVATLSICKPNKKDDKNEK